MPHRPTDHTTRVQAQATWNASQHALRAEWDLLELDGDPANLRTVDPLRYDPPAAVKSRQTVAEAPEDMGRRLGRESAERAARFRQETPLERARLALTDRNGEVEAVVPIWEGQARAILQAAVNDAARRSPTPVPWRREDRRPDGRELLTRLGADPNRGRGVIRCPAHEDRSPSLAWRLADDGRALIFCHSGCQFTEILAAVS